jgi:hypothetical protein
MSNAVLVAWIGFVVSGLFLSLQIFEVFFYLAILSNYLICRRRNIMDVQAES